MKNSDYWKIRFSQLEAAQNGQGAATAAEIEKQYKTAQKQLEGQISLWYQRFAGNNGITLAQARQYLKGSDLQELQWNVKDYIKNGQENALTGRWIKQLENASAKFHISKLEALKIQTQQCFEEMFSKQLSTVTDGMSDIFQSGYYHTAFEIQKGLNIGWNIAGLDKSSIENVILKPWAADGKNFSERIWSNKQKLISEVHGELTQNILLGADPKKAIDSLAKKMNTSKYNAGRLIMTEEAYFSSAAQQKCFEDLGVEEYEVIATLDSHTSDICRNLDGKHFPMKDYQAGVTAPPFHVFCRSTTAPYFEDDFGEIGERAARDKDGKTYYVPGNMTYEQWKKKSVVIDENTENVFTNKQNDDIINNNGVHCYGDYLRDALGSARKNNVEELREIITAVESKGGKVIFLKDSSNMVTDISKGNPGIIKIDENASIAAVLHEYRHFLDDEANGYPGLAFYLRDSDKFFEFEKRGYEEELKIAREYGLKKEEQKILNEIEKRRREIYGIE